MLKRDKTDEKRIASRMHDAVRFRPGEDPLHVRYLYCSHTELVRFVLFISGSHQFSCVSCQLSSAKHTFHVRCTSGSSVACQVVFRSHFTSTGYQRTFTGRATHEFRIKRMLKGHQTDNQRMPLSVGVRSKF